MGNINLDSARAERTGEAPTVTFEGVAFELPREMPFAIVEAVRQLAIAKDGDDGFAAAEIVSSIGRSLLRERYDDFIALGPSMTDMSVLLEQIVEAYGMSLGESQASES